MSNYIVIKSNDYLAHHGILGMKWGVWNDETRARYLGEKGSDSKKKEDISSKKKLHLTDGQKKAIKTGAKVAAVILVSASLIYLSSELVKDYSNDYKKNRNDDDDSADIYGMLSKSQQSEINSVTNLNYNPNLTNTISDADKQVADENGFKTIKNINYQDSLNNSNPFYNDELYSNPFIELDEISEDELVSLYGSTLNCGNTVIAEEMRRRGIDVVANPNPSGMGGMENVAEYFKGIDSDSIKNIDIPKTNPPSSWDYMDNPEGLKDAQLNHITDAYVTISRSLINSYPEGSRGIIQLPLENGGHFMSWEIADGKAIIKNPQNPSQDNFLLFNQISTRSGNTYQERFKNRNSGLMAMRLDNLQINSSNISEVVSRRTNDRKAWANTNYRNFIELETDSGEFLNTIDFVKKSLNEGVSETGRVSYSYRGENFITNEIYGTSNDESPKYSSIVSSYRSDHPNTSLSDDEIFKKITYRNPQLRR